MDIHGNTVGKANVRPGVAITDLAWNCERFNMEEQSEISQNSAVTAPLGLGGRHNVPGNAGNGITPQPQPYLRPDGKCEEEQRQF